MKRRGMPRPIPRNPAGTHLVTAVNPRIRVAIIARSKNKIIIKVRLEILNNLQVRII